MKHASFQLLFSIVFIALLVFGHVLLHFMHEYYSNKGLIGGFIILAAVCAVSFFLLSRVEIEETKKKSEKESLSDITGTIVTIMVVMIMSSITVLTQVFLPNENVVKKFIPLIVLVTVYSVLAIYVTLH